MFMLPPLTSALNMQVALNQVYDMLRQIHDAADTLAPNGTPELWNALKSIRGAQRDIRPYANVEHQAWLDAEYKRQQEGKL